VSLQSYLEELADPDQPIHASKLAALSMLSADDFARFLGAWSTLGDDRRRQVMDDLVDLAEDNVELNFDPVFTLALGDIDAAIRRQAIRGLWEYEGSELIDRLVELLEGDADGGVRAEAALALGRFALKNELDELRHADGEKVDRALRAKFEDQLEPSEVRGRALESLGVRSEPWVRALIESAYEGPEPRLRLSAVHAMGQSADASWLATLRAESENEEAEMRFEVASAAGAIGDEEAIPFLIELSRDEDDEVQEAAIAALGEIGGDAVKEALRSLMDEPEERVRDAALAALREAEFVDDPLGVRVID
jgi:HEAT repeat protein